MGKPEKQIVRTRGRETEHNYGRYIRIQLATISTRHTLQPSPSVLLHVVFFFKSMLGCSVMEEMQTKKMFMAVFVAKNVCSVTNHHHPVLFSRQPTVIFMSDRAVNHAKQRSEG